MIKEPFRITNYDTSTQGHSIIIIALKIVQNQRDFSFFPATFFLSNSRLYLCLYAKEMQNKVS